jgi:thymidylate kinase
LKATKLILLEGVPGSGKSTAAHFLDRHLTRCGVPHRWWYEEEAGHPLSVFPDAAGMHAMVEEIFAGRHASSVEGALQKWRALAQSLAVSRTVGILDGALFGHMTWTLFPADVPESEITEYVANVERLIRPLDPSLIYLRPTDMGAAMDRIAARRGGEPVLGGRRWETGWWRIGRHSGA